MIIWMPATGVPLMVAAIAVQRRGELDKSYNRHVLAPTGLSFRLCLAISQFIPLLVYCIRPYDGAVAHPLFNRSADPSFSLNHATATFAIAAAFLLHGEQQIGMWFLVAAAVVTFSRFNFRTRDVGDTHMAAAKGITASILVRTVYREGTRLDRFITSNLQERAGW